MYARDSVLRLALCDDGVDLPLLLRLDALLNEDVRDGDADDNSEDDGDAVHAEAQCFEQLLDGDGLDVQDGEEEAVEEDAGDEGDDGRDDEQGIRRVNDMDDLQRGDANDGSSGERADRLRQSKLDHEHVADEHGHNALEGDDGKQLLWRVEHDGEATCREDGSNRLIEIGVGWLYVHVGDVVHACNEDGKGDAEGHAADDEHGIHCARHTRGGEAVQQIARGVDRWEAGHEEDGTGDERIPHRRKPERSGDDPCAECCDKARNHGARIWIERVSRARAMRDKTHERRDGGDECLEPAAAEELARAARADGGAECDDPVGIAEWTLADAVDRALDRIQRCIAAQDAPCQLADSGKDGEVDTMLNEFAELCKGALAVADAEHKCRVGDVRLDLLGGNPEMHRRAPHVAHDA